MWIFSVLVKAAGRYKFLIFWWEYPDKLEKKGYDLSFILIYFNVANSIRTTHLKLFTLAYI